MGGLSARCCPALYDVVRATSLLSVGSLDGSMVGSTAPKREMERGEVERLLPHIQCVHKFHFFVEVMELLFTKLFFFLTVVGNIPILSFMTNSYFRFNNFMCLISI